MKAEKTLLITMLIVLMGIVGGCHYGSYDDHRGYGYGSSAYGYGSSSGSYREGFRDGQTYESRRNGWNYGRYADDYYRRR